MLAAAIAGALLGDGSAFWAGHRSQREILARLADVEISGGDGAERGFLPPLGTLAVFFARFVPPIRAFVPVTAGALGMPPAVFFGVNIPAVFAWALAHVLPGVLAVSALHEYAGLPHHQGIGKHLWMLAVFRLGDHRVRRLDTAAAGSAGGSNERSPDGAQFRAATRYAPRTTVFR